MRHAYRIVRFLLVSLLSLTVGIPLLLYVLLSLDSVHEKLRHTAAGELSELLGADVTIGAMRVVPFSRLELDSVAVATGSDTMLHVGALNAGLSLHNLLRGRLVVTDVELLDPDLRVWRSKPGAPLNVDPVLQRLKGDGQGGKKSFDLAVHTVVIRGGRASYNVLSVARNDGFDPAHIEISDLRADITAPRVSDRRIQVNVKRLNFAERSGQVLRDLTVKADFTPDTLRVEGLRVSFPRSELAFGPVTIDLHREARHIADIELLRGSYISPSDFTAFAPALESVPGPLDLSMNARLFADSVSLRSLSVEVPERLSVTAAANATTSSATLSRLALGVDGADIAAVAGAFKPLPNSTAVLLANLGRITFSGNASWRKPRNAILRGQLDTDAGSMEFDATLAGRRLGGVVDARNVDLAVVLPGKKLGPATFAATFDLTPAAGSADLAVSSLEWRDRTFGEINLTLDYQGRQYEVAFSANDPLVTAGVQATVNLTPADYSADIKADISHLDLDAIGAKGKFAGHRLSALINADFAATELTRPSGQLRISDIGIRNHENGGVTLAPITLSADLASARQLVKLDSDIATLQAEGSINLASIVPAAKNMLAAALPQYFPSVLPADIHGVNDFTFSATVNETSPLLDFLELPLRPLYPITLTGDFSQTDNRVAATIVAPYIKKGNKLIHDSKLDIALGTASMLKLATTMPSKQGDMALRLDGNLADGLGTLGATWKVDCANDYSGDVNLTVRPLADGADIRILPGRLTFNNADWTIEPAFVGIRNRSAVIGNINVNRPGQEAVIRGVVSSDPADRLSVKLDNIDLDYIFDTLQLGPAIIFGGTATGTIDGSGLLSGEPVLQTDDLFVRAFSYGGCVMGDAAIKSRWNNDTRGIEIRANVAGRVAGGSTVVDGVIFPLSEDLEFTFHANHTPLGFLKPLMSTFASDVDGTASGSCHLFGNFKDVNLEGDMLAENFALTVAFTGVTYFAGDSIHIRPGIIDIPGITLRDATGQTARFSGRLTHDYFRECSFDFHVADADRMLVYDMCQSDDLPWFGTVRGSGTVNIKGVPGYVKIAAEMSTAPGTEFSFSLSDRESASEYNLLTFRDATPMSASDSLSPQPGSSELHKLMLARLEREQAEALLSNYDFDFQIDVTPQARLVLIMDPNAGDKITAYGSGHVGILYGSGTDDLRMYGDYRIARGDYNFSLQDIILKNFSIRDGSEVSFHGDPLDAGLDISAIYKLNANLSDLDDSFLTDKEVQRTNVPVYAVLNVGGSIQNPLISFDLDFPTLSSDVKRKVASIVSTDEMMNRQIIYLLALNRFYTPDYMSATKGNELVSVATGTISSQLSNILGQLSDKISVAPSVRSDTDDFSDVEFDVALSSTLLNNRLLLNGNLGYRDKALNNNQFIGDFDVEYLLNRTGNWRLKAYNHFNDRNLYVKTAMTTQGIGIVFKHDFDSLLRALRRNKKPKIQQGGK